jgi:KaiC/GvpD/RAD55 family RecA-like ATPase
MGMASLHESKVYLLDMGQLRRGLFRNESKKDWVVILLEIIREAVAASGYETLAVDSLEALYAVADLKAPRSEMFQFLSQIKELGLTTFVIAETPFGATRLTEWGEDFLVDGILHLRQVEVGDTEVQLRLQTVKMRWMNHDHSAVALNHDGEKFFVSHVISRKK